MRKMRSDQFDPALTPCLKPGERRDSLLGSFCFGTFPKNWLPTSRPCHPKAFLEG
jgi:hypothetical protein